MFLVTLSLFALIEDHRHFSPHSVLTSRSLDEIRSRGEAEVSDPTEFRETIFSHISKQSQIIVSLHALILYISKSYLILSSLSLCSPVFNDTLVTKPQDKAPPLPGFLLLEEPQ